MIGLNGVIAGISIAAGDAGLALFNGGCAALLMLGSRQDDGGV